MHPRRVFLAAATAILAACGSDKPTGPSLLTGSLGFTYTGGIAGSFNASGVFDGTDVNDWAWGWRDDSDGSIVVGASVPRGSTSHDLIGLVIPRTTVGSSTVTTTCTANTCADMFATFGMSNTGTVTFLQTCVLESGTLTIASITSTRVTGSFTGTGSCIAQAGGSSTFTVTNGTFDVALLATEPD